MALSDATLLEQLLLGLRLPDEFHQGLPAMVANFNRDRVQVITNSLNFLQQEAQSDSELVVNAANGVVLGIMLAQFTATPDGRKRVENWLEGLEKERGKNVVCFTSARIKKGK